MNSDYKQLWKDDYKVIKHQRLSNINTSKVTKVKYYGSKVKQRATTNVENRTQMSATNVKQHKQRG